MLLMLMLRDADSQRPCSLMDRDSIETITLSTLLVFVQNIVKFLILSVEIYQNWSNLIKICVFFCQNFSGNPKIRQKFWF